MTGDFLDEVSIKVIAGKGGDGIVSFRREKYVPKGGPDGGDGGDGASVIIKSTLTKNTLVDFKHKRKFIAEDGENGKAKKQYGKNGNNLIIEVPVGTIIYDKNSEDMIADLKYPNQIVVVARGGKGGRGNVKFMNSSLQAPRISEKGIKGEEIELKLVLKLIADIGIVGFPNVGKSTLISRISKAKPKIANYHFTTLKPNLGVVKVDIGKSFVVADIPGLIEGAHNGTGLGDRFLRHIERCYAIIHIIDIAKFEGRDPVDDYYKIRNELKKYSETLANKKEIIFGNKCDLIDQETLNKNISEFEKTTGKKIHPISAYTKTNLDKAIGEMWTMIEPQRMEYTRKIEKMLKKNSDRIKLKIDPVRLDNIDYIKFEIIRWSEDVYEITGTGVEKLLSKYDIEQKDARVKILNTLESSGLSKFLAIEGLKEGDTVYVGNFAFEYIP
ncbi:MULTISPECIES: GTPase ObgE [Oceanotoga]|jgi:GTP-binding protein|uniref:GTPase Obg n=1 Tax=Oceanotoga teriensis TaxID=515440 RepID=A0AA45C4P2_9BACT|nr:MULTISPECIES: GTPase ObgE [Oceanotoga]MDN5341850.1 GTPase [Oceanotoga sp.]MDO7976669.1 GTPase ObgE [Oceanotoga teriensis]PWJ87001.1 GTP-binding protein [Oceanotoga teriensis]